MELTWYFVPKFNNYYPIQEFKGQSLVLVNIHGDFELFEIRPDEGHAVPYEEVRRAHNPEEE